MDVQPAQPYELIEFFAGRAHVARCAQLSGFKSAAVDLRYDCARPATSKSVVGRRSPFDINSES